MIFKDNDEITIGFSEDINATYMVFKKQLSEDDFIEYHQEILDELNTLKYNSGKHLVDTSNLKIITATSRKWIAENLIDRIQRTSNDGKAHIAVVLGQGAFLNLGICQVDPLYKQDVNIQYFSQSREAEMWLSPVRQSNFVRSLTG